MISYFPQMYKDEILYSVLGRYNSYCCHKSYRDTIETVFGSDNTLPSIEFPSQLKHLSQEISKINGIDADYFINNHTMYPYYSIFLPKSRQESIEAKMINGDGKGIKAEIGFIAGSVCKKSSLCYCPECVKDEIAHYGEAYFHRVHQAQGVFVCPEHKFILNEYPVKLLDESRLAFIKLECENIDYISRREQNTRLEETMINVSNGASYLLSKNLGYLNKNLIHGAYMKALGERGYLTSSGRIRQNDLCRDFFAYYGSNILIFFQSSIDIDNEYNWVKVLTRNEERVVHPVRHLLFINFISTNLDSFINGINKEKKQITLYPCLNPVSGHYRQLVISDVKVTADWKTREPVGTFTCHCGFIYSRKMDGNMYKIGRIKQFGQVWEAKLQTLILEGKHTVSGIANELRCDYKTVVKYADKLGLRYLINTNMQVEYNPKSRSVAMDNSMLNQYTNTLIKYIDENPSKTYCEIRKVHPKEFNFIYAHDKAWIQDNIPKKDTRTYSPYDKELWFKRDEDILTELQDILFNLPLLGNKKITKTMLMRKTGKQALIEKNIDKLPLCKDFLDGIVNRVYH